MDSTLASRSYDALGRFLKTRRARHAIQRWGWLGKLRRRQIQFEDLQNSLWLKLAQNRTFGERLSSGADNGEQMQKLVNWYGYKFLLNHLRDESKNSKGLQPWPEALDPPAREDSHHTLQLELTLLPPPLRKVVELRHRGLTLQEVARRLGIAKRTVSMRQSEARALLRRAAEGN